ncbi:MAG: hypothetical protein ABW352_11580 [Polyangiales bacterium]
MERVEAAPLRLKPVLITALALLLGALVGITLLDRLPEAPKQGRLAVAQLSPSTEILAVGSSHIYTAIDPALTGRPWVNLSAGLMNYVFMDAVIAAHLERAPNLHAVLLDFDPLPAFTDSYGSAKGDFRHLLDLAPSFSALDESLSRKLVLGRDHLFMYDLPFRRAFMHEKADFDTVHRLRGEDWSKISPGHQALQGMHEGGFHGAERAEGHYRVMYDTQYMPRNLAAFARIIARVKAAGVPLILVRIPVHASYRDASPPEFAQAFAALEARAREASPDAPLPVLDYTREPAFGDDEFFDGDHLNQLGAARLTPRLAADVRDLLQSTLAR